MWIFKNDAMISMVEDFDDSNYLVARARNEGDLERTFPGRTVYDNMGGDYKYRCWISKEDAADIIAADIRGIDYFNFKDSIPKEDNKRHDAYLSVWTVMYKYQNGSLYYGQ